MMDAQPETFVTILFHFSLVAVNLVIFSILVGKPSPFGFVRNLKTNFYGTVKLLSKGKNNNSQGSLLFIIISFGACFLLILMPFSNESISSQHLPLASDSPLNFFHWMAGLVLISVLIKFSEQKNTHGHSRQDLFQLILNCLVYRLAYFLILISLYLGNKSAEFSQILSFQQGNLLNWGIIQFPISFLGISFAFYLELKDLEKYESQPHLNLSGPALVFYKLGKQFLILGHLSVLVIVFFAGGQMPGVSSLSLCFLFFILKVLALGIGSNLIFRTTLGFSYKNISLRQGWVIFGLVVLGYGWKLKEIIF